MTIILDGIRLSEGCLNFPPRPRDTCTGDFTFHIRDPHGDITELHREVDVIPFVRSGSNYSHPFSLTPIQSGFIRGENFDISQQGIQLTLTYAPLVRRIINNNLTGQRNSISEPLINDFFNFIMVGEVHVPDPLQVRRAISLIQRLMDLLPSDPTREFLWNRGTQFILYNESRLRHPLIERTQVLRDLYEMSLRLQHLEETIPTEIAHQCNQVFVQMVSFLYFGEGDLNSLRQSIHPLAVQLYQLPPQGNPPLRLNLYRILQRILEEPLHPITLSSSQGPTSQQLIQHSPFNVTGDSRTRLQILIQWLSSPIHEQRLRYEALSNPRQHIITSLVQRYSDPQRASSILATVHLTTQIRGMGTFYSNWLADRNHLNEVLQTLLFDPHPTSPQAQSAILGSSGQAIPTLTVRVSQLRTNYSRLMDRHPRESDFYRIATLVMMHTLFGNGEPHHHLLVGSGSEEIRFPLEIESRRDLVHFYEEITGTVGASSAANTAQTAVQWVSLVLCVTGGTARAIYNTAADNWDGRPDAFLAAAGVFCGYALGSFGADMMGGSRVRGRILRNNIAGTLGAAVVGTASGTLPLLHSPPTEQLPPPPPRRPLDGRNPNVPRGCDPVQGCGP